VRRLFRDLREVISESGQDGDNGADHQDDAADDPYSDGDNGYVPKGKEAKREDSQKSSKKEERRREKEREWLRVIEAEMQQVETIDEEEERHEEWVRLKQALTKGMERALLRSDRRRAEFTLRAAAAKASSITADDSGGDSDDDGEAAKKQKNEDGKTSKNESDAVVRKNESENGGGVSSAVGRRREGTRRGKEGEEEDDGWNSDGFDTSREATMAREIMGLRSNADGEEGDEGSDRTDDEDDDVEEEEDSLLESDKRRHAKRKRKSRRGRKKAPTRRIYSYGQETADVGFEGEPETDQQSFAGPGVNANGVSLNYGSTSSRKSFSDRRHDFDPTSSSSSSFWSCFCC
jgi:hypothetical protein